MRNTAIPLEKGNTIGQETRWGKGQVANPAGRPPDTLRRFIHAELDKIGREAIETLRPGQTFGETGMKCDAVELQRSNV